MGKNTEIKRVGENILEVKTTHDPIIEVKNYTLEELRIQKDDLVRRRENDKKSFDKALDLIDQKIKDIDEIIDEAGTKLEGAIEASEISSKKNEKNTV